MKDLYIGIDTSNYTTSLAAVDLDGRVVANLKRPLPVKSGERGLRQSDAVFEHVRNLPSLMSELHERFGGFHTVAVGVSVSPRDAKDSYMPCFLSGRAAAFSFAVAADAKLYEFSHQNGHIMAAIYSSGGEKLLECERFLAFHVSGGTTEALLVAPNAKGFSPVLVGATDDINAGQAIDRVGVAMGLAFPAGRALEALASEYEGKVYKHKTCVRETNCSLSGVENIAMRIYENEGKNAAAAFVFDFLARTLGDMRKAINEKYGDCPTLFAGGVMSNKIMREYLAAGGESFFAEPEFSADNAAGIALLTRKKHLYNGEGV